MPKAIRLYEHGGPDRLKWEEGPVGAPGAGEILIRQTAIGVDYIDVYVRTGLYPRPLPTGIGFEAAGVITALGPRVRGFKVGDRVGYSLNVPGAYAEQRLLASADAIKLPRGISDEQAAAVLLKGLTAWSLVRRTFKVKRGHVVLLPAAAGGVGLIVSQWIRALGARVIGVVGSAEKSEDRQAAWMQSGAGRIRESGRAGQKADAGQGRRCGLRRDRQGHLHGLSRLPKAAGPDGDLWQRLRRGAARGTSGTDASRFPVPDASDLR